MGMVTCRKLGTQHCRLEDLRGALREDSMTNSLLDLSVVICTRNRAAQLTETLKRVSAVRSQLNWELIIVDNDSTDGTSAVVQEFAASCAHPVHLIVKPGRGVSGAKNAGWRSAKAGIVVCIDDDCYPEEDYFDSIFELFSNDPKLGFVGGRILLHDPTDRRITIQESLEPLSFPPGSFIRPGVIQGANIAYRRAALTEVGGFDPWFGAGALYSGDETELMARISAAGWNGAYNPKPVVYHHHGRKTADDEWRLMRWYDRGRGAYYAKCILNRGMRNVYFKNWLLTRQHHSWKKTALEIVSGLEYVARACLAGRSLNR
jgi:glycosyltransferase involved in cell wall biosynthesis